MNTRYSKILLAFLGAVFTRSHFACNSSELPPKYAAYMKYRENGQKHWETQLQGP